MIIFFWAFDLFKNEASLAFSFHNQEIVHREMNVIQYSAFLLEQLCI
jgi:hypothetical protein